MYRAYFVDGLNIALVENLLTVVWQLGLLPFGMLVLLLSPLIAGKLRRTVPAR